MWTALAGCALILLSLSTVAIGRALVAREIARTAADLGALAGAPYVAAIPGEACARAAVTVTANHARMVACRTDGLDLIVTTRVDVVSVPGMPGWLEAGARAGPVRAESSRPDATAATVAAGGRGLPRPPSSPSLAS